MRAFRYLVLVSLVIFGFALNASSQMAESGMFFDTVLVSDTNIIVTTVSPHEAPSIAWDRIPEEEKASLLHKLNAFDTLNVEKFNYIKSLNNQIGDGEGFLPSDSITDTSLTDEMKEAKYFFDNMSAEDKELFNEFTNLNNSVDINERAIQIHWMSLDTDEREKILDENITLTNIDKRKKVKSGKFERFELFGVVGITSNEDGLDQALGSARLLIEFNPYYKLFDEKNYNKLNGLTRLSGRIAFNKGDEPNEQSSTANSDPPQLDTKLLVFPELSSSSFMGGLSLDCLTIPFDTGLSIVNALSPFYEYSWQTRSFNTENKKLSFDIGTHNGGLNILTYKHKHNSGEVATIKCAVFYSWMIVSEASENDFKTLIAGEVEDSVKEKFGRIFHGYGTRVSFSYKGFIIEYEYRDYKAKHDLKGDGIVGGQYTIKTAVNFSLL